MRILILNSDYPKFLHEHYALHKGLAAAPYAEQMRARNRSLFGVADFYSRNFQLYGHEAAEIHVNNSWLQHAWAAEHSLCVPEPPQPEMVRGEDEFITYLKRRLRPYRAVLGPIAQRLGLLPKVEGTSKEILFAQIEDFRPDVIFNQDIAAIGSDVMAAVRRRDRILIAQCGVDPPPGVDLGVYDIGISLIPWVVEYFRAQGLKAAQSHLAFEPSLLEELGPAPEKDVEVSFVGGLSSGHAKRIELLEAVAREFPVALWLSNFRGIPSSSPLHERFRGEVWGRDMYNALRRSKITLNSHINASRGMAGNMRLYEATGVGTFLLTDNLPNLPTLFEPGAQVGVYDSVSDCLKKIERYLRDDVEREAIAQAGQAHTLAHHTYRDRAKELIALIESVGR